MHSFINLVAYNDRNNWSLALFHLSQRTQGTQSIDLDCWGGNPDQTSIQLSLEVFPDRGWIFGLIFRPCHVKCPARFLFHQGQKSGQTLYLSEPCPPPARSCLAMAGGSLSLRRGGRVCELKRPWALSPELVEGSKGRRGAGERNRSTKLNSSPFQVFPDCVPGQCITSFIFRVLRMSLNPLPLYLMWLSYCKQFLPKIPV